MNEDQNVEWKRSWRDEYLKWICGFANVQGGVLEIGRNDRGEVVGVKDLLQLLEYIPNKVQALLGIVVEVNLKSEGGAEYLEIVVNPHPNPISYKGEFHYRSGSTRQVLRGASLSRFLLQKYGKTWDDVPMPGVGLKDLDGRTLESFRRRAADSERLSQDILDESDAEVIEKLRLREGEYLKRAAVLLFHPAPGRFVREAYVKIGYFRGPELLYQDVIEGDLFAQVDRTMDLLYSKYTKALISYDGVYRIETFPVPNEAMREAVINAVIHRDYASTAPIQISADEAGQKRRAPGESRVGPGGTIEATTDVKGLLKDRLQSGRERLEEAREAVKALCEPVEPPHDSAAYLRFFCAAESGDAVQLKENEPRRVALYKLTVAFLRAYANLANEMQEAGYSEVEAQEVRVEVDHYEKVRQEVKLASGDYIDMKMYEPAMRHLLDTYIRAGESERFSDFDDLTLVRMIVERGTDAVESLPAGIRRNPEAVAETIENNVRRIIIDEMAVNPRYYEKMSELLDVLIRQRRQDAMDYKAYLAKVVALTKRVHRPETEASYPRTIHTAALLEYVVVHEMVHLIELRHNDRFRDLMDRFLPRWRLHRDHLNRAPLAHEAWRY